MNIKAENLQLQFGNQFALKDVSFEINGEKIYGLLGRNGAGKTSLLSIIASFREPTAGTLTINGEIPFENAEIMQQVAFLYQKDYTAESDNAVEVLTSTGKYRSNFDKDYAFYLLDQFKLDREKPVKKFSKGMQSTLNAIIGLASRAPITIFDEVYLGMDSPTREVFYKELLKDQEKHPRIIILSTHLVSEMEYLFDEVIILKEGTVLLQEPFDSLISKGATITGQGDVVDEFVRNKKQLGMKTLGNTKAVTIFGELSPLEEREATELGLEVSPVSLHDLFIHLTEEDN